MSIPREVIDETIHETRKYFDELFDEVFGRAEEPAPAAPTTEKGQQQCD